MVLNSSSLTEDIIKSLRGGTTAQKIGALNDIQKGVGKTVGVTENERKLFCPEIIDLIDESCKLGSSNFSLLLSQVLQTVAELLKFPECLNLFSVDNCLLGRLACWSLENEGDANGDTGVFMIVLEMLTREIQILSKPPFLRQLVSKCFKVILNKNLFSQVFNSALATIVHICDANPVCIMATLDAKGYKEVWNLLYDIFKSGIDKAESQRTMILITHLMLILDINSNYTLLTFAFGHLDTLSENILEKPDDAIKKDMELILLDLVRLFEGLTNKIRSTVGPNPMSFISNSNPNQTGLALFVKSYIRLTKATALRLGENHNHLRNKSLAKHILRLITALTPAYQITELILTENFSNLFDVIQNIERSPGRLIPNFLVYEAYAHIISLLQSLPIFGSKEVRDALTKVIKSARLTTSTEPDSLRNNIACCRIYGYAQTLPTLLDPVLSKIQEESRIYSELLTTFLCGSNENRTNESISLVTEMLGLLTDNSRSKGIMDILMQGLRSTGASEYLALAIQSSDQHIVARALSITRTVTFSKDNLKDLSENLVNMKQGVRPVPPSYINCLSTSARKGFSIVEKTLESIAANAEDLDVPESVQLSDVVAIYESKKKFMESEMSALREELYRTNQITFEIQKLLDKHSQLIVAQTSTLDLKEKNIRSLKQQVEELHGKLLNKDNECSVKLVCLKEKLTFAQKTIDLGIQKIAAMEERVTSLEHDKKGFQKQLERERSVKKCTQKDLEDLRAALSVKEEAIKASAKKLQKLERDHQRSKEEKDVLEILLAKEKQTVEVIRGVLANNNQIS